MLWFRNVANTGPFDKEASAKAHSKNVIILGVVSTMEDPVEVPEFCGVE